MFAAYLVHLICKLGIGLSQLRPHVTNLGACNPNLCLKAAEHPLRYVRRNPLMQAHQILAVAVPDNLAAATRASPMAFGPRLGQQPQMVGQRASPVGDSQCVSKSFFHPGITMRPLAERPFSGLLKPELAEKILIERAVDEAADGVVRGGGQPMLPHRDAAIAIKIDMAIGGAGNPAARLEDLGLNGGIATAYLHADDKFRDRPTGHGSHAAFGHQKPALDQDLLFDKPSVQLGLIERDRRLNRFERQQVGGDPMPWPRASTANRTA